MPVLMKHLQNVCSIKTSLLDTPESPDSTLLRRAVSNADVITICHCTLKPKPRSNKGLTRFFREEPFSSGYCSNSVAIREAKERERRLISQLCFQLPCVTSPAARVTRIQDQEALRKCAVETSFTDVPNKKNDG